ncbi:MAG: hypothetical protein AB7N80_14700, partial [Bdellovibrionales bacterium]
MNDFYLHTILRGIAVPMVVGGAVYILARVTPTFIRDTLRGAGLAAAVLFSYILLLGMPDWPLTGSPKGVVSALLVASIWPLLEAMGTRRLWWKRFALIAAVNLVCLRPLVESAWSLQSSLTILLGLTSTVVLIWFAIDRGSQQMQPSAVLAALAVISGTSAAFMWLTDHGGLAKLGGALAAALAIMTLLSLIRALRAQRELNSVAVIALTAIWCTYAFYTDISWTKMIWLAGPFIWFVIRDILNWSGGTPVKDTITT